MGRPPNWTRFSRNSKGASPHAVREAAGSMTHKRAIIISAEFASFVGRGALDPASLPPEPTVIGFGVMGEPAVRSEEHTPELQSLMRKSYAAFCLNNKRSTDIPINTDHTNIT